MQRSTHLSAESDPQHLSLPIDLSSASVIPVRHKRASGSAAIASLPRRMPAHARAHTREHARTVVAGPQQLVERVEQPVGLAVAHRRKHSLRAESKPQRPAVRE
jgi:hypothetical protein